MAPSIAATAATGAAAKANAATNGATTESAPALDDDDGDDDVELISANASREAATETAKSVATLWKTVCQALTMIQKHKELKGDLKVDTTYDLCKARFEFCMKWLGYELLGNQLLTFAVAKFHITLYL